MEPIRILHILHSMNRGGAETMLMNYYRNMDREKIQFDFLLTVEGKSDYEDEIYSLGGRIFHIKPLTLATMYGYLKELKFFLKGHPEYKIIHAHTSSKSVFALGIGKKLGIPVRISHSHNMFLGTGKFSVKEIVRKLLRNPLKMVSTHNFSCSKEAAIWLYGENYLKDGKVEILHNAIELSDFRYNRQTREDYRKQFNLSDSFVVGHVGRFQNQKNHSFLIEIFKKIKEQREDAKLLLVGEGPLQEEIRQKVEHMGLSNHVLFAGLRTDVPNLLQMMDVFLFPSLFEGLGIVLVEAQATGLPCITSKDVVPSEVDVADLVKFISLEETADYWAEQVLGTEISEERTSKMEQLRNAGYDIAEEAEILQNFYCERYESAC